MKMQAFNTNIHPIWDTMRFPFETPAISKLKSEVEALHLSRKK